MRRHAVVVDPEKYPRFRCRGCGFRHQSRSYMWQHIKACAIEELNPMRRMTDETR